MFVRPANKGLIVRHPDTGLPLPAQGGDLPDAYALRRIRDGSVVDPRPKRPEPESAPDESEGKARTRSARNDSAKGEAD